MFSKQVLILAVICVLVNSSPPKSGGGGSSTSSRSQDDYGNYKFSYEITDDKGAKNSRQEKGDAKGSVVGSYSLNDIDGRARTVNYVADKKGFRAEIQTNELGTSNQDSADAIYNGRDSKKGQTILKDIGSNSLNDVKANSGKYIADKDELKSQSRKREMKTSHPESNYGDSGECSERIFKQCINRYKYTEEDVENVRIYLQNRFSGTGPVKPVCKKLRVRKDIKCLTRKELSELIRVIKELYRNGVMDRLSLIHATYWTAEHKFIEGIPWHRWHIIVLENEMRKISPDITLPYWEYISEFSAPELSVIWDVFGRSGNKKNDYCVSDGAFAYQTVKYPKPHCLRREWNKNGTIPVWEPPEIMTSLFQFTPNFTEFSLYIAFDSHFKTHLYLGGFHGDFSIPFATNEIMFYLFHNHIADYAFLKWQLSEDSRLVPQSYTGSAKYNYTTQTIGITNIETDVLNYYTNVRLKETFQVGYGELCYIYDQMIQPINDLINNIEPEFPIAVQRLQSSLSPQLFAAYFPKFAANTATYFDYMLPDIGNCPQTSNRCKPMPIALSYNSTAQGRRLLNELRFRANLDITPQVLGVEQFYYKFMDDLNESGYCSPYVK